MSSADSFGGTEAHDAVPGAAVSDGQARRADLRQAEGRGLHEKLANMIGSAIVSGAHPPGTALPPEMELCARMSVSRSALREAFKLLTSKRLIRSRQKVGTQVRPRDEWNMLDGDVLAWHIASGPPSPEFVAGLFEMREIVEPQAAALAAERRPAEALEKLRRAVVDMRRFALDRSRLGEADLRFHAAVLQATENPFIASFNLVIEGALAASFRLGWDSTGRYSVASKIDHHALLASLIAEGKPEQARRQMMVLLDHARSALMALIYEQAEPATEDEPG